MAKKVVENLTSLCILKNHYFRGQSMADNNLLQMRISKSRIKNFALSMVCCVALCCIISCLSRFSLMYRGIYLG